MELILWFIETHWKILTAKGFLRKGKAQTKIKSGFRFFAYYDDNNKIPAWDNQVGFLFNNSEIF